MAKAKPAVRKTKEPAERLTLAMLKDQYLALTEHTCRALSDYAESGVSRADFEKQIAELKAQFDSDKLAELEKRLNVALSRFQNAENAIEEIKKDLGLAFQTLEKFGGTNGLIADAIAKADDAKEYVETKLKGGWKGWIIPALAVLLLGGFMLSRGCDRIHGSPKPAPDQNEQSILDDQPSRAKKLTGAVVFLHDRDPLSAEDARLLDDASLFKAANDDFRWQSLDYQDDKNETIAKLVAEAHAKGIEPPIMVHKSTDGKISYAPMAKTWPEVVKAFGK